ncbi:hypothetical protein LWI29_025016 [Acer saccharum]|uniref:F-box domain-containing protein n=1 Tax=Acer saccharum TaxID=4024 RepID=A0AA39RSD9_ACESA|nr:hypothetical protein LWI29_025016 [Acer saccharum]KAK1556851.1 hypothetical protein Q3G72_013408 [Acer saccharum]
MEEVGIQISQMLSDESMKDNGDVLVAVVGLFLPCEIFFEILSWLPAKYLVRCTCVCKQWYKLIKERSFIMKHWKCSEPVTFNFEDKVENLDVDGIIVQETFKKEQVFAGLILEKGDISCKYRLRNFTTQEILYLPNPHKDTLVIIGYNVSGEIKLMSLYGDGDKNRGRLKGLEILNLDRNDKWRPLKFPILEKCRRGQRLTYEIQPCKDILYCIKQDGHGSNFSIEVCSLDMRSERFFNNTLPLGLFTNPLKVFVFKWNGFLAFGDIVEEKLNLIVLEDHKMHKWSETKIVIPLTFVKENPDLLKLIPAFFHDHKFWFRSKQRDDKVMFTYDTQSRKISKVFRNSKRPSVITFKRKAIGGDI